jgi:flavin-dependent dehydrogenase
LKPQKKLAHAIVIGGGIAGLLAARVLLNHFEKVTLLERDHYPEEPVFRPGVPQGRHVHVLLLRGQRLLETFFPGLLQKLLAQGAIRHEYANGTLYYYGGGRCPRTTTLLQGWNCSRLLIEWQIRQELTKYDQLQMIEGHEVCGLLFHQDTVLGVQYRARNHTLKNPRQDLYADLVIDTSGSSSRVPQWLQELGYEKPKETETHTFLGYATRFYERSAQIDQKSLVIQSTQGKRRGGALMAIEGDRWMAVLAGTQQDYPPTNDAEYLEFARSLPETALYEFLKQATPVSPIYGYRRPTNRIRHFELLSRLPEHFLVMGDAVCSFNPVYGQGMTVAALEAKILDERLSMWKGQKGFSRSFQRKLARVFAPPWQLALTADSLGTPQASHQLESPILRGSRWYMDRLIALLPYDQKVFLTFLQVIHMLRSPSTLIHPGVLIKVISHSIRMHFKDTKRKKT